VAAVVAVTAGILARTYALGRLPSINGDEAWYGANLQSISAGYPVFWFTPSGNPLNPLHSGPLALLLAIFAPAPALLRVPEVMWSIAALLLAIPLLRKSIGLRAAIVTAMLLSASTAAIGYGRMGWDVSATPLTGLLVIAAALADRPFTLAVAMAAALIVHPTNIFLIPIAAAAWLPHGARRYSAASPAGRTWLQRIAALVIVTGALLLAAALWKAAHNPNTPLPSASIALGRATSIKEWLTVLLRAGQFFAGLPTMSFIAGPVSAAIASAAVTIVIAAALPLAGMLRGGAVPRTARSPSASWQRLRSSPWWRARTRSRQGTNATGCSCWCRSPLPSRRRSMRCCRAAARWLQPRLSH
jgi:hypothetical protein